MSDYTTWNPADKHADITLSDGDLKAAATTSQWRAVRGVSGKSSGKWYFEVTFTTSGDYGLVGVASSSVSLADRIGVSATGWGNQNNGFFMNNNATKTGVTHASTNVVQVAVDLDNGKIWWGLNGAWYGGSDPASGTGAHYDNLSGTVYPAVNCYGVGTSYLANFGASAFAYSVPSGFNSGWTLLAVVAETNESAGISAAVEPYDLSPAISEGTGISADAEPYDLKPTVPEAGTISAAVTGQTLDAHNRETPSITMEASRVLEIPRVIPEEGAISVVVTPDHLVDTTSPAAGIDAEITADYISRWRRYFPNISSRRVVLKYISNDSDYGMELYYSRMKVFKTIDRLDDVAYHPNLTGNHLTLKIVSDSITDEESLLAYASIQIHARLL